MPECDEIQDSFDWSRAFAGILPEEVGRSIQKSYLAAFKRADVLPALKILNQQQLQKYAFHNKAHTASVLWGAILLAEVDLLGEIERENLVLASFYHDTGYINGAEGHEEHSAALFKQNLQGDLSDDRISEIVEIILSTRLHMNADQMTYTGVPRNALAKYLLDADLLNVGFEFNYYCSICLRLASEMTKTSGKELREEQLLDFQRSNLRFLNQHRFHTDSATRLFLGAKQEKIEKFELALRSGKQVLRKS